MVESFQRRAVELGLIPISDSISPEIAFKLVRDMPYSRATSREPETTISEWKGTCSGKHYLLKEIFTELGFTSSLIACTTQFIIYPKTVISPLRVLLERSDGQFVDVHNYLTLELPTGKMIVDAT